MKINFVDFDTGKEISLDQQLLNTAKGIALSSFQQLEITEWMRWLGLPTNGTVLLNRKHRMLEWKVEMYDNHDQPTLYAQFELLCLFYQSLLYFILIAQISWNN